MSSNEMESLDEKTVTLNHPTFGCLMGVKTTDGPVQFRNVPYSNPPSRWRHSSPLSCIPSDPLHPYDATRWGPAPPQPDNAIDFDFGLIQKRLNVDQRLDRSEEECLNMVITTPSLDVSGLPVMVLYVIASILTPSPTR